MKKILTACLIFMAAGLCSFDLKEEIQKCYITYKKPGGLKLVSNGKVATGAYQLKTDEGEVQLSPVEVYRSLYNNKNNALAVVMKVEVFNPSDYDGAKQTVQSHLRYLHSQTAESESVNLDYNGSKIYGVSRTSLTANEPLGTFVIFPGNNTIVSFSFNSLKPENTHYLSLTDYQGKRNSFLANYATQIRNCK